MNKKGFTLIELLVVIAVLGILAAVVLVAINPTKRLQDARNAGVKSDVGQIGTALEAYYTENNGVYPANIAALVTDQQLKQAPTAPSGRPTTCTEGAGDPYSYVVATDSSEAAAWAELEDCGDASEDQYVYWTKCGKTVETTTVPTASNVTTFTCP